MYFGIYEIDGDPDELLAAYDRLIGMMPEAAGLPRPRRIEGLPLHAVRAKGV